MSYLWNSPGLLLTGFLSFWLFLLLFRAIILAEREVSTSLETELTSTPWSKP